MNFTQLLYHIVFSTKGRANLIAKEVEPRLHAFMGGVVRDEGGLAYRIGGMPDHVHLLVRGRPDGCISDLVRHVKSRSTRWVHETFAGMQGFAWQEGYGAFTIGASQKDVVDQYIAGQERHHRGRSFEDEFLSLLRAYGVQYDERFVLD